jgi:glycosyltransferase involved in cell wall biosynthesis
LRALVEDSGLRRVHVIAWRDLDDPGAGGSELHITELARRWVAAGAEVTLTAAAVPGLPSDTWRHGIRVRRRGGPLTVYARNALDEIVRRNGPCDGLVEVWHGVSFLAPAWTRVPTIGIAHHVHTGQFAMVLPRPLAAAARFLEARVYPRLYRRTPLVTLSDSVKDEFVALGYDPAGLTVVSPGVAGHFGPGARRADHPLVISVGRLMPQKNAGALVDVLVRVRARHPGLEAVLVGDGPERAAIEAQVAQAGAAGWLRVAGRVGDDELVDLYRRAWVLASASLKEGWGMTVTEAGACGTPAVVTRIPGHDGAVVDGVTGLLVSGPDDLAAGLDRLLGDEGLRRRLGDAAREHAAAYTWDSAAHDTFAVLVGAAEGRRRR